MLLGLRERISGYIAWIFVILITIPFVLWGIQEYTGIGEPNYAIKVNDERIPLGEYERTMAIARTNLAQAYGGRIPPGFDVDSYLRKQAVDQLIQNKLMDQLFKRQNYRVDGAVLQDTIMQDSYFQIDGKFSNTRYREELRSRGVTPEEYQDLLRHQMLTAQLSQGLVQTSFVPESELVDYVKISHQSRDFAYLLVPFSDYEKNVKVSGEEIEKYFNDHPGDLMTDERVKIAYLEFSLDEMAKAVSISDNTLRDLYKSAIEAGRYQTEETRNASHILVRVPDNADEAVIAEKKKKAEEILQRLRKGEDFAAIAKKESEDPGSAQQGGDLGDVRRGVMVKPFEDALYAMKKGELSEPVLTRFGFHIIRLNSIEPPQVQTFNEVKDELEQNYRKEQTDAAFYERLDRLQTLSFENPGDLAQIGEQLGLKVQESDFFTRKAADAKGIAAHPAVREAAFSNAVLIEKQNSSLIEVDDNHVVVLRIKEHEESRPKTLAEARSDIAELVKHEKAARAVDEAAAKILAELPAGKAEAVAKRYAAQYKSFTKVKREDPSMSMPHEIRQAVFKMPAPAEGKTEYRKISLANGDAAVLSLQAVKPGDIATLNETERKQLRQQVQQMRGRFDYSAMLAALRDEAEIRISDSDIGTTETKPE
ncbi:MAG TPA: SurA N-terminal domain-containing protein [Gammaproteobacteria bacterium]|nr:SurA N-terminal domain-containing protein [Gammaproteobacteria bacterium]